jgi:hypothetical protein
MNPPATLLGYILKYLEYRPDPRLFEYREKLEIYEWEVKKDLPDAFLSELNWRLRRLDVIYILGRIFTATVTLVILFVWVFIPVLGAPWQPSIHSWSETSWLLYFLVPCYLSWSFLGWLKDNYSYRLLREYQDFFVDDDCTATFK